MSFSQVTVVMMAAAILLLSSTSLAQSNFKAINNATTLTGTWSSGSQAVTTGLSFYNPITKNFTVPTNAGISYSFTDDGYFETSTFTYTANATVNRCFTAALTWQHGTYSFNANNSLTLTPFVPDGLVQVMDPCAATTVQTYQYSQVELVPTWYTYQDNHPGFMETGVTAWALQMYSDGGGGQAGAAKNVMWLAARPPNMLPTQQLYQEVYNQVGA